MRAIILAAGYGNRIHALSQGRPKGTLEIGGISLLHHQIHHCLDCGIDKFTLVLGYEFDLMRQHVLEALKPDQVDFVENPDYRNTNTLHSLYLARGYFSDDIVYFNGDILFDPRLLERLLAHKPNSALLIEEKPCGEEEVKVILDDDGRIRSIGKLLDPALCLGEFIGIARFRRDVLPRFAHWLEEGVAQGQSRNYFEWAVDKLAAEYPLEPVSTAGLPCIEIDFPEDFARARNEVWPAIQAAHP
jgi:choline kinase